MRPALSVIYIYHEPMVLSSTEEGRGRVPGRTFADSTGASAFAIATGAGVPDRFVGHGVQRLEGFLLGSRFVR